MLPTFSQNLTLQEAFETAAQINEELRKRNSMVHFAKNSNLLYSIDFLHLFAKRRISVENMIHEKQSRGHRTPNIVSSRQSYSNGHLPYYYIVHFKFKFYCLACESMHEVLLRGQ